MASPLYERTDLRITSFYGGVTRGACLTVEPDASGIAVMEGRDVAMMIGVLFSWLAEFHPSAAESVGRVISRKLVG